jgi:hypothetical protein
VADSPSDEILTAADDLNTSQKPPGYDASTSHLHIELSANNSSGQPNEHDSYVEDPTNFLHIMQAANSNAVDTASWTPPTGSLSSAPQDLANVYNTFAKPWIAGQG